MSFPAQGRQALLQPPAERQQLPHFGRSLALGTGAQADIGTLLGLRLQALDKQARLRHHPLARGAWAALVMRKPGL